MKFQKRQSSPFGDSKSVVFWRYMRVGMNAKDTKGPFWDNRKVPYLDYVAITWVYIYICQNANHILKMVEFY